MTIAPPARVLPFVRRNRVRREPSSPFRHLMPPRPLTPREILHRRRMMAVFAVTRVTNDSRF